MKVIACVFNNLYTDQRVEKVCRSLLENGYEIELIGNSWGGLPEMNRPYPFHRINLNSSNLKLAYPEFNFKLYFELLKRADKNTVLLANDLDTLAASFLVSRKLNIPLVYDSHEIFTEMPAVNGRFAQKIWRQLERNLVPKINYMITASDSYATWFEKKYLIKKPVVVQNFPVKISQPDEIEAENEPKIILYQGVINPSRGLDKVIPAMKTIGNAQLWIAGDGPKRKEYEALTKSFKLEQKIKFLGKLPPSELRKLTGKADVGLSIEENNGESYYYSLPNKISDYIQAGIPIVVSNFPEMKRIIEAFEVGECISNHSEQELSSKINRVLTKGKKFYKKRLELAATKLCWENEEPKLIELFKKLQTENFQ